MTALVPDKSQRFRCGNSDCNAVLSRGKNYSIEAVCNRCITVSGEEPRANGLCDYCDFNDTNLVLTIAGNREMWKRLEETKRQLLYTLDLLRAAADAAPTGFPGQSIDEMVSQN